jgi:hypothetical protein
MEARVMALKKIADYLKDNLLSVVLTGVIAGLVILSFAWTFFRPQDEFTPPTRGGRLEWIDKARVQRESLAVLVLSAGTILLLIYKSRKASKNSKTE